MGPHFRIVSVIVLLSIARGGRAQPALGERLVHDYEAQTGMGSTPELERLSGYIRNVGNRVAGALPSHLPYQFIFDPNPAFRSAFALPDRYIVVGGGLLALAVTEDELANALAHEIEHVELGQVGRRVTELINKKRLDQIQVSDFFPGYGREDELASDLNGQKLAAAAGYSPAGTLTLLQTFEALRRGPPEERSDKRPTLSERIAQATRFAGTQRRQVPLKIP